MNDVVFGGIVRIRQGLSLEISEQILSLSEWPDHESNKSSDFAEIEGIKESLHHNFNSLLILPDEEH
jgi:hypothetical protein